MLCYASHLLPYLMVQNRERTVQPAGRAREKDGGSKCWIRFRGHGLCLAAATGLRFPTRTSRERADDWRPLLTVCSTFLIDVNEMIS
jgi:hypothetical protein